MAGPTPRISGQARLSACTATNERCNNSVANGKGQMPPWKGVFSSAEMDRIWHFIRANANDK